VLKSVEKSHHFRTHLLSVIGCVNVASRFMFIYIFRCLILYIYIYIYIYIKTAVSNGYAILCERNVLVSYRYITKGIV